MVIVVLLLVVVVVVAFSSRPMLLLSCRCGVDGCRRRRLGSVGWLRLLRSFVLPVFSLATDGQPIWWRFAFDVMDVPLLLTAICSPFRSVFILEGNLVWIDSIHHDE